MIENVDIEFKELDRQTGALPEGIIKTVVSFANTEGGEIYIGVSDDGKAIGVPNPDDIMTRLSNLIHDTVLPEVLPFVQIRAVEMDKQTVVKLTVTVGTERPYYLAKEGLKPKGVYIRRGTACIPLNEAGIREMIRETSGKSFEESRSLNQQLTFNTLSEEMKARSLEFGPAQMKTMKLTGTDELYTNLALLLSDQCPYTIKVAVFQGKDNAVFRDRKEFTGSLLKQLEDAYRFLDFYNKTQANFSGLRRSDRRDYPEDAVREALLNCIIHRDYLFSGSTIINMYDDFMEFISLGGLVRGISMDAVFLGVSQSRNPNLAAVLYRMKLVESYGTGVRKIMRLYRDFSEKPHFRTAEGAFTVVMYNRNENAAEYSNSNGSGTQETVQTENVIKEQRQSEYRIAKNKQQKLKDAILKFVQTNGEVSRKEVEENFGFGSTKAFKYLKMLCEEGLIIQEKLGNKTTYVLNQRKTDSKTEQ